jgi:hypothetical protein
MSEPENDAMLTSDERAWVERLRTAYAAPAMTRPQAAAFDARLRERIEARSRRGTFWVPAASLLAASLAIWMGSALWNAGTPQAPQVASTWESELILGSEVGADDSADYLPEDYLVIADAFFGE